MRRAPIIALLAAAPLLLAVDRCGLYIETTENLQFLAPVSRVVLDVHHGSVTATSFDRPSVSVKRHTSGFERGVGEASGAVDGDTLTLVAHCAIAGECWYNHMLELPLDTALELTFLDGYIEVGQLTGPLAASVETGHLRAYELASPTVDIDYGTGDVSLQFVAAPAEVMVVVGEGDVDITVPAGAYACDVSPAPALDGVTCDPAAPSVIAVAVASGRVTLRGV